MKPESNDDPVVLSVLLHAHLPFGLGTGNGPTLEETWLFEAVIDSYLPLLGRVAGLPAAGHGGPVLSLSLSPTLLSMWRHPDFPRRFRDHLTTGGRILEREAGDPAHPRERRLQAQRLVEHWRRTRTRFDDCDGDLAAAFAAAARAGRVELLTTAATHPFLPAYQNDPRLCAFQIATGIDTFTGATGLTPEGFWIPECGYYPGLEERLAGHGIGYFGLEDRGLTAATPPADTTAPLRCANGLLALGRNSRLSRRVWSARAGYPGHPDYREFHRDAVHVLDPAVAGPYALPDGGRMPLGLKYWRVTGSDDKEWYDPDAADRRARTHAREFLAELRGLRRRGDGPVLAFLPFDAELFGHWWHEGPQWLDAVLAGAARDPGIQPVAAAAVADRFPDPPRGQPAASSWGRNGDYSFWVNHDTDWIYPMVESASRALARACDEPGSRKAAHRRLLAQAARELLLAQASDWPFMLRAGGTVEYANQRLREHLQRFHHLLSRTAGEGPPARDLELIEALDPVFPDLDTRDF